MAKRHQQVESCFGGEEKDKKWLAGWLGKEPATVSKWCTNASNLPFNM